MNLTDNLISYYKLDGNSNDAVGSNNGTDTDITYSLDNGKINQGAGFNGSTSLINLGNNFNLNSSFSILCWIKTTQSNIVFMGKGAAGEYQWALVINSSGYGRIYLFQASGASFMQKDASIAINNGSYHCLCFVYDSSVPSLKIYTDGGNVVSSSTQTGSWYTSGSGNTNIGGWLDSNTLNGVIDEVGIWSRALSSTEVTSLYNGGAGNQYPFLGVKKTINIF